jgi:hypothetical protein
MASSDAEIGRLEDILKALPADRLMDNVSWETVASAMKAPAMATVATALQAIERHRSLRGVRERLEAKLVALGRRLRETDGSPQTERGPTYWHFDAALGRNVPSVLEKPAEVPAHEALRRLDVAIAESEARGETGTEAHACLTLSRKCVLAGLETEGDQPIPRRKRNARS